MPLEEGQLERQREYINNNPRYRRVNDAITVAECKTLNCLAQALCRTKNAWWQQP